MGIYLTTPTLRLYICHLKIKRTYYGNEIVQF